jgi:hypothetical protein
VLLCGGSLGEEARGLDDNVNTQFAPGEVGRIALGKDLDDAAVDNEVALFDFNGLGQPTADGVVLQKVGKRLGTREVVDRNNFEVRTLGECCAEVVAADAAKAVDTNTGGHYSVSLVLLQAHLVSRILIPTNNSRTSLGRSDYQIGGRPATLLKANRLP